MVLAIPPINRLYVERNSLLYDTSSLKLEAASLIEQKASLIEQHNEKIKSLTEYATALEGQICKIKTSYNNGHFYSPVVDPADLDLARLWPAHPKVLGVDFNDVSHEYILRKVFPRYATDYDYPEHFEETPNSTSYYTRNSQFSWLDSAQLVRSFARMETTEVDRSWFRILHFAGG